MICQEEPNTCSVKAENIQLSTSFMLKMKVLWYKVGKRLYVTLRLILPTNIRNQPEAFSMKF